VGLVGCRFLVWLMLVW